MNLFAKISADIARQIALWHLRRELTRIREHLFILHDQVDSGEEGIRRYEAKERRLEEQINSIEPAQDVIRRAGVGA